MYTSNSPKQNVRDIKRQALAILAQGTPEASQCLLELLKCDDPYAAASAASQVLDRVLGRPSEVSQISNDEAVRPSSAPLEYLTADERTEMNDLICAVQRFAALAQERADAAKMEGSDA
jgi:hypothetical protein